MKKLITLVILTLCAIGIIAQDTIRHEIPQEQQDNVLSIFTYFATLLAGWFIGIFGRDKNKEK